MIENKTPAHRKRTGGERYVCRYKGSSACKSRQGSKDRNDYPHHRYDQHRAKHTEAEKAAESVCQRPAGIFGFVTPQAIYKWQRGSALPSLDNLVVLSAVFGVSIDDILALAEPAQELLGA